MLPRQAPRTYRPPRFPGSTRGFLPGGERPPIPSPSGAVTYSYRFCRPVVVTTGVMEISSGRLHPARQRPASVGVEAGRRRGHGERSGFTTAFVRIGRNGQIVTSVPWNNDRSRIERMRRLSGLPGFYVDFGVLNSWAGSS